MDKERIEGFGEAFAPGEVVVWLIPKFQKERKLFYEKKFAEFLDNNITAVFAVSDHYLINNRK